LLSKKEEEASRQELQTQREEAKGLWQVKCQMIFFVLLLKHKDETFHKIISLIEQKK
jgi:hypothetical protein